MRASVMADWFYFVARLPDNLVLKYLGSGWS